MMPRKGSQNKHHYDEQLVNEDEKKEEYVTPRALIEDSNEGVIAFCHCKNQMIPLLADSIYEKFVPVFCNNCWSHVPPEYTVYHCTRGIKGRCWEHPVGCDICVNCAKKQMKQQNNKPHNDKAVKNRKNLMTKLFSKSRRNSDNEAKLINVDTTRETPDINISPTLQSILTQQLFLHKRPENDDEKVSVSHLSIIDEITRLSALSNSTLSQLAYANKTDKTLTHSISDLQEMIIKYNALQQLQDKMLQSIQKMSVNTYGMIEDRLHDWKNWNKYQLCEWIMSLDQGRFYKKYCVKIDSETDTINIVKESILQQNICGKHLGLDDKKKDILIQSLGINDFDDRMALLDHIQNVTNDQFVYDQMLALVPAKNSEIPGYQPEDDEINDADQKEMEPHTHHEEMMNGNDHIVEIEGVNLHNNHNVVIEE